MENENKNFNELIEKLASKLGTTTEMLWNVMIKQAKVEAITMVFQFLVLAATNYGIYMLFEKFVFPYSLNTEYKTPFSATMISILGTFGFLGSIAMVIGCFTDFVTALVNPKYWALNKILEKI